MFQWILVDTWNLWFLQDGPPYMYLGTISQINENTSDNLLIIIIDTLYMQNINFQVRVAVRLNKVRFSCHLQVYARLLWKTTITYVDKR